MFRVRIIPHLDVRDDRIAKVSSSNARGTV
jgi:hypothetical protein